MELVDITVDGNGSIVLTDNITSYASGGSTVTFDGAVVIKGDVTITTDTSEGHATNNDGKIDFFGAPTTILGHTTGTNNLTLLSGAGTIDLDGKIGATSGSELDKLHINASASAPAALNIPQIGADASTPGTTGVTKIGNASSGIITLSGDTYAFGGGATTITSGDDIKLTANSANNSKGTITTDANNLTIIPGTNKALEFSGTAKISGASGATIDIQGDVLGVDNGGSVEIIEISVATAGEVKVTGDIKAADASGAHAGKIKTITLSGPGTGAGTGVYIGGELVTAVNDTGNNIDINGNVLLTGNTTLDTTANNGTIDFSGKIDSSSATNHTLTLKSAGGAIKVNGVIGSTNDIGALAINDDLTGAGEITLSGVGDVSTPKIGITGTVDIGHTSTAKVILNGTAYNIDGDTTITTTTGADKIIIGDAMTIKTDGHFTKFVGGD